MRVPDLSRSTLYSVCNFQMASSSTEKNSALRFAEFGALSKRMLAPIEGYDKMPVVSIKEAVQPLIDIVPNVLRNVFIVNQNCEEPEDGLTPDESASIMLYTYESEPHEDSLYVILNTALRSEQRQKLKPWFSYLRLVLTGLARLPSERRFVNRGVREDLRPQYPKGKSFIWWGFSSCTSSVDALECEQFFGKTGTRTLFQIDCYSGKDVKSHSFIQQEEEILLLPARQFVVKACLDSGNGLHIIQLQETEPEYPLLQPISLPNPTPKPKSKSKSVSLPTPAPKLKPKVHPHDSPDAQKGVQPKTSIPLINLSGQCQWRCKDTQIGVLWSLPKLADTVDTRAVSDHYQGLPEDHLIDCGYCTAFFHRE